MAIERRFYCEGPDCERYVRTMKARPVGGFVSVTDSFGGRTQHFCGWDCVMKYAATKEPERVMPWDVSGDGLGEAAEG